ncbi:hypothetical protein [Aureimonas sp. Leaf454]|uniref:DUF6894 family protein n=1 Tax=Aureimonas sp. Leaf454 TaxID=1736381 RepID=UPI0012E3D5C3|nr:hypothetical protein [Aureimonas sp. Leaf454]
MRYYFNVLTSEGVVPDDEGTEFASLGQVCLEAEAGAREILAERLRAGEVIDATTTFEVKDESGTTVHVLPFTAVLLATIGRGRPSAVASGKVHEVGRGSVLSDG